MFVNATLFVHIYLVLMCLHIVCMKRMHCMMSVIAEPEPECRVDPDCLLDEACLQQTCQDPCQTLRCGQNAECKVNSHRAYCVCKRGFEGDPEVFCEEREYQITMFQHLVCLHLSALHVKYVFLQLDARVTLNAVMTKHAFIGSARTPACLGNVVQMPSANHSVTKPTVFVPHTMMVIHSATANPMSVSLTLTVQPH